ncbi:DUF1690 domain-containing protein [Rutstroemia sp. NJR-2017a BBW]|nr:DUF1690 domain-containing protein [Rutstroemia sp. NJR-2017a BBW]
MGSGASKPDGLPKAQVWTSSSTLCNPAPRFVFFPDRPTLQLENYTDQNKQTDSTRAKTLELHIQARVADELKKLQERASKDFEELTAKLSSDDEPSASAEKNAGEQLRQVGRDAVQKDVQQLKTKLERRRKLVEVDEGVVKAKSEVVRCLRENDRRPLDCWREVEAFRREVRRLEGEWVEKVVR